MHPRGLSVLLPNATFPLNFYVFSCLFFPTASAALPILLLISVFFFLQLYIPLRMHLTRTSIFSER
jgi:hypothetical protein